MRVSVCASPEQATARAVARIARTVRENPRAVLGLATGGTMEPVYRGLIEAHRAGLGFAGVTSFNLDEYVGLDPAHPQSYHSYMRRHFFDHVDIPADRRFLPCGNCDPAEAAAIFEARLEQHGPVDLQLLGLGHNGHIGFNEPGSSLGSLTREKTLTRRTRDANARFFGPGEVPPQSAVTMGIATIMRARSIVLLALGAAKAEAVAQVVEGPVTAFCPGSALQYHRDVSVILDEGAAKDLRLVEHYREAELLVARRAS